MRQRRQRGTARGQMQKLPSVWKFHFEPPSPFTSFDHLVGAQQERFGDRQPERLGGGQIEGEIELSRLLDRKIAWLRSAKNLVDIVGGAPVQVRLVWSIGRQTSRFDDLPAGVTRRQSRGQRQSIDADAM